MEVIPLFKTHHSLGRSILTLEKSDACMENGPSSAVKIAEENGLEELYLVEDNMSSFLQAYTNLSELKIKLIYGVRITVCPDMLEKSEESRSKSCKYIIFSRNNSGYKRLIKLYSTGAKDGFYYEPRLDFKTIKEEWSNKDLLLGVPFYDSFIFKNSMNYSSCIPEFDFTKPVFFMEDNSLPFDDFVSESVKSYCGDEHEVINSQSIYYENKKDFKEYLTFRCINNRTTLDKPNFDHMCSDEFCFEKWRHLNQG